MILKFAFTNFRSFKERVEFSLEPTPLKEHSNNILSIGKHEVLRSAVIYGPNASGKSNIIRALEAIRYLVIRSSEFKPGKLLGPYEPFKLDTNSLNNPVSFEIEFLAGDSKKYLYRLSYNKKVVVKEEAYIYHTNQKALIYSRNEEKISYGDYYKGERKSIEKKLLPNQLFLSKAILDNVEVLNPVYSFFEYELFVFSWLHDFERNKFQQLFAERLAKNDEADFNRKFNKLICALDTGITEVKSHEENWETVSFPESVPVEVQENLKRDYPYDIKTVHKVFDKGIEVGTTLFDHEEESQGTKNLFSVLGIILDALDLGTTLVIDEFDNNLHPHITKLLIKLFHNPRINKNNAQLILATHDISQLDNDVFRRDQIWFTEKDEFACSTLFSLSDIKGVRNTVPYDKWYNSGKFGATPIIDELELMFDEE